MDTIHSHKDLIVWQKSIDLTVHVYTITKIFPFDERFGLSEATFLEAISTAEKIWEDAAGRELFNYTKDGDL